MQADARVSSDFKTKPKMLDTYNRLCSHYSLDEMTILFIQITDNFPYKTDRLLKLEILSEIL